MNVYDLLRTKDLAVETRYAVFAELDDGQSLALLKPCDARVDNRRLHMNYVCRANHIADAAARALQKVDGFDHRVPIIVTPNL